MSSPEHSAPHAEAAAEDLAEPLEGDAGKPPFAKVLENIRSLNKLQAPAPKKVCEAYSTIEVEQGAVPKPSVPISLPVSPLLKVTWDKFEEMVAGARSSLLQKSKLLVPVPFRQQGVWYVLADSSVPLTRQVPLEFCDLVRSNHITVAAKDTHVSVCLLYTSPSPRDGLLSRMPSSA